MEKIEASKVEVCAIKEKVERVGVKSTTAQQYCY